MGNIQTIFLSIIVSLNWVNLTITSICADSIYFPDCSCQGEFCLGDISCCIGGCDDDTNRCYEGCRPDGDDCGDVDPSDHVCCGSCELTANETYACTGSGISGAKAKKPTVTRPVPKPASVPNIVKPIAPSITEQTAPVITKPTVSELVAPKAVVARKQQKL